MKNSILILFVSFVFQSQAQQITTTFPDTVHLNGTLKFETISYVRDNWGIPPFCSPLVFESDSLINNDLIYDLTYDFTGPYINGCARKDTFEYQGLSSGNYRLICFWSRIDSTNYPPNDSNRYGSDTIQIHVRNTTSIAELEKNSFSVFPNPVYDEIILSHYSGQDNRVEIIDLNGRILRSPSTINGRVSVADLEPGIYFLRIREKSSTETMKFVKK
jgi:hypothetical protein